MNSAAETQATRPQRLPPAAAPSGATHLRLRVLLADDCRDGRMLVTAMLLKWGIVPTLACNGEQAVGLAQRLGFDVVLMNVLLPVMNGIVATARIRQFERETWARRHVPIVAYTALDLGSVKIQLKRVGLTLVLPKPCSSTSLRSCLERCCPGRLLVN